MRTLRKGKKNKEIAKLHNKNKNKKRQCQESEKRKDIWRNSEEKRGERRQKTMNNTITRQGEGGGEGKQGRGRKTTQKYENRRRQKNYLRRQDKNKIPVLITETGRDQYVPGIQEEERGEKRQEKGQRTWKRQPGKRQRVRKLSIT